MKNKKIIYLTIGLLVIVLLISLGTFAYWNWMSGENKNVVFNTSKALKDYITYNDGESKFVGDFQVSDSYLDGVHTTISMKKDKAANVSLMATINMDINAIGETMKVSPALKWVVTSGDSTNVGDVLSSGNFIGSNAGDTMVLLPNIEVLTTEQKFTIWIWIDSSENPSADLTGETLDTVVWTQIDQVEGVVSTFSITRKSTAYQTINATVVNNTNKIVSYAVTTSNTEPSTWTSISNTDQSNVYNLEYTVSTTGTYYIWFKDSLGNVVGDNVSVSEIDTSAPVCTFGEFSPSSVANGETATVDLVCTDNDLKNINLSISDIEITGSSATLSNISKVKTTNGYTYTISLVGTDVDGIVSLALPSGKIFDSMNNTNDGVSSGNLTIQNDIEAPTITLSANSDSTYTKTKSVTVTIKDASSGLASGASLKYGWSTSNTTEPSSYTTVNPSYTAGTTSGVTFTASGSGLTGDYYLWVKPVTLKDTLGNSNTTIKKSTGTFKFDNTAPTGTLSLSSSGAIITATVSASDPQSGISEYQYAKGTSSSCTDYTYTSSTNSSYNFTVSSEGTYYVCVKIKDKAGNLSDAISKSIAIKSVNITYSSSNLIYKLDDISNGTGERMTYSVSNGVVTVTASKDDGYGFINARVYLEANETYYFNCTTSGTYGSSGQQEVFLMLDGAYNTYYHMTSNTNYSFTPTVSGEYYLRLDVNTSGETQTFSNIRIEKKVVQSIISGSALGTLPTMSVSGYTFNGFYTAESGGTKITTTTKAPSSDTTYYAHWSDTTPPTTPTTMSFVFGDWSDYTDDTWTNKGVYAVRSVGLNDASQRGPSGSTDSGSGVAKYQISSDNSNWEDYNYDNSKSMYYMGSNGTYYRYFRACDNAGNCGSSLKKTAKIDMTTPTVSYSVAGGTYTTTKSVTVTASDSGGSGFNYMNVHVYKDGTKIESKSQNSITTSSFNVSLDSDGTWYVYTTVYDNAGNKQSQSPDNGYGWYYQQYTIGTTKNGAYFVNNRASIANLSSSLVGGMYRFQGSASAVTNNYICFGTSSKSTCTGSPDYWMYRIIGVTSDGQIKVIKKTPLGGGGGNTYAWHNSSSSYVAWSSSLLYSTLNGSSFLTNTTYLPSGWSDKIASATWYFRDDNKAYGSTYMAYTGADMYTYETSDNSLTAKIGLMSLHDYYLAPGNGISCNTSGSCTSSWIQFTQNSSSYATSSEWSMARRGNINNVWYAIRISSNGYATDSSSPVITQYIVRPVFYISSSVNITGTGTISDPYIIG